MSITSDKNTQGKGLQELIDSYNRELMRIHSRSPQPESVPASNGLDQDIRALQENDAARKTPVPRGEQASPAPARPQSSFSFGGANPADSGGNISGVLSEEQQRIWFRELEDGMEELRKGLEELAKGQKELNDGLREWREGMNAGNTAVRTAASPRGNGVIDTEESGKWLSGLERGMEELREGIKELAKGQKALSDGLIEWQEGVSGVKYRGTANGSGQDIGDMGPAASPDYSGTGNNPHQSAHITGHAGNIPMPDEPPLEPPVDDGVIMPLGYGTLCVAVNTARQAMPIRGASITVTLPVGDRELLYSFVSTDSSGRSPSIELPVYGADSPESASPAGGYDEYIPRFRTYRVRVQAAGFEMRDDLTAEIFDGINSTLTAELEPLSGGTARQGADGNDGGGEGM